MLSISLTEKLISRRKSTAIFHGLLYFDSSCGCSFSFKVFTSCTPARTTDWNVESFPCCHFRYFSLSSPRKERKIWLSELLSTSSIIKTIFFPHDLHNDVIFIPSERIGNFSERGLIQSFTVFSATFCSRRHSPISSTSPSARLVKDSKYSSAASKLKLNTR